MEENRFWFRKKPDFGIDKNRGFGVGEKPVFGSEKNTFEFVRDLFKAKVVKKASWLGKNRF